MKVKVPSQRHANDLIARGYKVVVGIDEVGRGCLAGPVTAAAVILSPKTRLPGVRDSKLLNLAQREKLAPLIKRAAMAVGIGWSTPGEVDQNGLTWAVRQSGLRALKNLDHQYDAVLLDGNHNYLRDHCYAETLIKADNLCLNVAAASIIAKVARDRYMRLMHRLYPEFGFDQNVGYGTPFHIKAIKNNLSPLHRRLFAPVARLELALATPEAQDAFYESLFYPAAEPTLSEGEGLRIFDVD